MAKMHKCRRCGALLERSKHIVFSHFESRQERVGSIDDPFPTYRTVQDATFKHVACPKCGEAEPLNTIAANLAGVLTFGAIVIVVLVGAVWMLFFM